jgi:predicted MFS family arabinose efflux permease
MGYYDRNYVGVLMKSMTSSLNVSVAKCGVLASTYFWSYAFIQPFIGAIADLVDTSYIVSISLFLASIGSLICGLSRNFYLTCFSRFLVGIGCGCIYVPICRSFTLSSHLAD